MVHLQFHRRCSSNAKSPFLGANISFSFSLKKGNGLSESGSLALISPLSVLQQRNQQKRDGQMSLLLLLLSSIQKWSAPYKQEQHWLQLSALPLIRTVALIQRPLFRFLSIHPINLHVRYLRQIAKSAIYRPIGSFAISAEIIGDRLRPTRMSTTFRRIVLFVRLLVSTLDAVGVALWAKLGTRKADWWSQSFPSEGHGRVERSSVDPKSRRIWSVFRWPVRQWIVKSYQRQRCTFTQIRSKVL
jgi:hypothetical protein